MLKITYITHSSFFIETDRTCLLFDYYTGIICRLQAVFRTVKYGHFVLECI